MTNELSCSFTIVHVHVKKSMVADLEQNMGALTDCKFKLVISHLPLVHIKHTIETLELSSERHSM